MSRVSDEIFPQDNTGKTKSGLVAAWFNCGRNWMAGLAALLLTIASAHAQFGTDPVGNPSSPLPISVTASATGNVSAIVVLTAGAQGLDFAAASGSTCSTGAIIQGSPCTENVAFTPMVAGPRFGAVVLVGTVSGNPAVLGVSYLYGTGLQSLGIVIPGNENTFAGNGNYLGSVGDGGAATIAELDQPSSVVLDGAGNLYIADSAHNRIRMVCVAANSQTISGVPSCTGANIIETIAGNGTAGSTGNGGAASAALLDNPSGIAIDGAGNLYIADTGNNEIREIIAATGNIIAAAGGPTATVCTGGAATDAVGDGCPALQATLSGPLGVSLDSAGNFYIADTQDARVREVALSSGIITTVAGDGTAGYNNDGITAITAELNNPYAVVFDGSGNMYIPDSANNRVREVAAVSGSITPASLISTFAGTGVAGDSGDDGLASAAELWGPSGLTFDPAGNLYIADTQNNAIRKVNESTGDIATLIQDGVGSTYNSTTTVFSTDTLYAPIGLTLDGEGNLYIADSQDMVVRQIQSNLAVLDFPTPVRVGTPVTSLPVMPVTVENDGNQPLDFSAITPQADARIAPVTPACNTGAPTLPVANTCVIGASLDPVAASNPDTTYIDLVSNPPNATANSPVVIKMIGIALATNSTTTTVTSNPNPSDYGNGVTFTVAVTTGDGISLNGTVSIADTFNGVTTVLATGQKLNPSNEYSLTISTLAVGLHSIVAYYTGDTNGHLDSNSTEYGVAPLIQTVDEQTTTTLTSSAPISAFGQSVTFTAVVAISAAGGNVTPTGYVAFMDGSTMLGSPVALVTSGGVNSATLSTSTLSSPLAIGIHPIVAVYYGDSSDQVLGSTSAILDQDVQATTSIALASSLNPSTYGQSVTFTATITSASTTAATGSVVFYDGTNVIGSGILSGSPAVATFTTSLLNVGTHSITAHYAGDTNNSSGVSTALSQVVNVAPTTTVASASPNPALFGTSVTIAATVTAGVETGNLTGTVNITDTLGGVTTTLASGLSLNPSGVATFTTSTLAVGTHTITATYGGDTDHGTSSATFTLVVALATSATTLSIAPNPGVVDAPITFTALVSSNGVAPTGTVTFLSGTTPLGTAPVTNGTATFTTSTLAAGTYTITASYGGDTDNAPSTSSAVSLTVNLIPTTTSLVVSATAGSNPQTVLTAVVVGTTGPTPTGTVTFTGAGATLGTATLNASGQATLTLSTEPAGSYTVVATYSGDSLHAPSTSAPATVTAPPDFNLAVAPNSVTMKTSQNAAFTVTLTSIGSFADTIGLGCSSLPAGVTCIFSSPTVTLAANGTATAQLTIDTNSPLGGGSTAMNSRPSAGNGMSLAGLFLPLSALFGFIIWRLRKRSSAIFSMVLVVALSTAALLATGCGGLTSSSVKPGQYVIQVTGTGSTTGVTNYQNVTLNITN